MRNCKLSISLLTFVLVQCLANLDNPTADSGIFMEDLCLNVKNHVKLANPFDKLGYFECVNGETIEKVCPGKREFNLKLQRCGSKGTSVKPTSKLTLKEKLKMRKQSTLASKYQSIKAKPAIKNFSAVTVKPKRFIREVRNSEELTQCVNQDNWKLLPHENNCRKYYLCVNEVTYPQQCSRGEWFDDERQGCVPQRESRCTHKAPENYCEGVPNFFKLESPDFCEDYFMCVNDISYFYRCDNGEWFDQKNQRCDSPDNVDCIIYNPPSPPDDLCDKVPNFKYVASPYSCSHYYQCILQRPYFKKCPEGYWFDNDKQSCRDKHEVECTLPQQ
ncbi:peritrophin-48-like [Culicoides brevitarsis]|uniref:peritrophin-48-like n=1 Tax=Culicoides brevitarsis TaxID=469753 RepID=UPI00307B8F7A